MSDLKKNNSCCVKIKITDTDAAIPATNFRAPLDLPDVSNNNIQENAKSCRQRRLFLYLKQKGFSIIELFAFLLSAVCSTQSMEILFCISYNVSLNYIFLRVLQCTGCFFFNWFRPKSTSVLSHFFTIGRNQFHT